MGYYGARRDLYASKAASDITSEVYWVGDAENITLFANGSPSTTTVQGNLESGRTQALPEANWSNITTIISPTTDQYDVAPYHGWIRALRSETTLFTVAVHNRVR